MQPLHVSPTERYRTKKETETDRQQHNNVSRSRVPQYYLQKTLWKPIPVPPPFVSIHGLHSLNRQSTSEKVHQTNGQANRAKNRDFSPKYVDRQKET